MMFARCSALNRPNTTSRSTSSRSSRPLVHTVTGETAMKKSQIKQRKGGWPKGKPRKPVDVTDAAPTALEERGLSWRAKIKAESTNWRDESSDNLFSLPAHVHAWLNDNG